jgi:opacity protein-like surface antigen
MRKLLVLGGAILCLSMTAAAQDAPAAFDASSPASEPAAPVSFHPSDRATWQLGVGFQYQHFNILGQTFHDFGYNADLTYYLTNWFGVEGTVALGFGNTGAPLNLPAKSFFVGGGPHVSVHHSGRFEPWVHALVGWEHFRFRQTSTLGSNSKVGFMAGGGVDYKIFPRGYWRVQGDAIVSSFGTTRQANYSIGTGLVLNF